MRAGDVQGSGKGIGAQAKRFHEIFPQNFSGMYRAHAVFHHGVISLVIVNDFNIDDAIIFPFKADPPFVVDADAVLSFSVSRKLLQSVAWWDSQEFKAGRGFKLGKLAPAATLSMEFQRLLFPVSNSVLVSVHLKLLIMRLIVYR
jgi:hypothetical protein